MFSAEDHRKKLESVRSELALLRVAAFTDFTPVICGQRLGPMTLRTFTLLRGWGNAFVCGGPLAFKDIVQFVWVHHPRFGQFEARWRRRVVRAVWRSLNPRFPTINAAVCFLAPIANRVAARRSALSPWRAFDWVLRTLRRRTPSQRYEQAVATIREHVRLSLHDFPSGDEGGDPLPYALQAQLVSDFVRHLGCDFQTATNLVETIPLRRLVEHIREIRYRTSGGRDKLLTTDESRVWAEYQDAKQAQIDHFAATQSAAPTA